MIVYSQEVKSNDFWFDHQMMEAEKKNQGFYHQESSDELEKMSEKPFSSDTKLHKEKPNSKINGTSASDSSARVCEFCGRHFSSGKALGGHKRHHIQALKKLKPQNQAQAQQQQQEKVNRGRHHQYLSKNCALRFNPTNNISEDFVIGDDDDDDDDLIKTKIGNLNNSSSRSFPCSVCDKGFPWKKSLFGHMRSHPEREWRGMKPPFTTADNNALASSSAKQLKVVHQHHEEDDDDDEANILNNNNNNGFLSSPSAAVADLSSYFLEIAGLRKIQEEEKALELQKQLKPLCLSIAIVTTFVVVLLLILEGLLLKLKH